MCFIKGVVIDQFTLRLPSALYILTHWHSDHYNGINKSWNNPIYTSHVTRNLLLTKYPSLQNIVTPLPLRTWTKLSQQIEVLIFDSNHMAGSIMVLLRVEDKYYLHTGDMRWSQKIAENTPEVFRAGQQNGYSCRYAIEQLHLDNTFCDPIFKFPTRSKALRMVIDLVKQHNPTRLFICTDTVGKEEAFLLLGRHYQSKVAVNCARMIYIQAMNLPWRKYFTNEPEQTWIEVIARRERESRVAGCRGSMAVTLTGWTNLDQAYPDGFRSYLIPYSLHSNFRQMEELVQFVRPRRLVGVVRESSRGWDKLAKTNSNFKGYMFSLYGIKQRGMPYLRQEYCVEKEHCIEKGEGRKGMCSEQQQENADANEI